VPRSNPLMAGGNVRIIALALALGLGGQAVQAARIVDPASARQAVAMPAVKAQDAELAALAAGNDATTLAARLEVIARDRTFTDVAQEWLLDRGLHALARIAPTREARASVARLAARRPTVYTRVDPDHGERATPLYDAGATARFVLRNWDRNAAREVARAELAAGATAAVDRFSSRGSIHGADPIRAGIADAFRTAPAGQLPAQRAAIVESLARGHRVDELALILAERLVDPELFGLVLASADEPVALAAVASVSRSLDAQSALDALSSASRREAIASAAVLEIGRLARNDAAARRFLFDSVSARDISPSAAAALAALHEPAVSAEIGRRLATAQSEESRRLLVLALRLDASPSARAELERFAKTGRGSAQLQKKVRQWLVR